MTKCSAFLFGAVLSALWVGCSDDTNGTTKDGGVVEAPPWDIAFDAESVGWFLSAWGPSADDVYAIGGHPDEGMLMHYDGTDWSPVDLGIDVPLLNWGYGFSGSDITFVGSAGTVVHFDGTKFETQDTPTDQDLWGVWGASPADLWAVGGDGRNKENATILHYDGTTWTKSSTPTLSRPNVAAYFKVWGASSNDVYVVGQSGALMGWDGSKWSEIESGASEDLIALWGTGPDNIVAIGGRSNGQAVIFDGATWTHRSLAPLPGLNGVWMRTKSKIHIAGLNGTIATLDLATGDLTEEPTSSFLTVHALFGTPGGELFAVGGSLLSMNPPFRGLALTRDLVEGE